MIYRHQSVITICSHSILVKVRNWNRLPQDTVQICTPEVFRSALQCV